MKIKIIMTIVTITVGISLISYFLLEAKNNLDYFVKNKINAKIIRVYNYENKSLEFYYDENYCITTTDTKGDTLIIGDSIVKEKDAVEFDIFRKNKRSKYEFFKKYFVKGI
jgi:hypothetical protein